MKRFILSLFLLLVFAPQCHAQSSSRLDQIIERGVLRVGTSGDYKPFTSRDGITGEMQGLDIDMARSLGAALGVKVEFVQTSWPTLMADFAADKFDIGMGGISVSLERQKKAFFSMPYLHEGKTPIARCEHKGRFQTLSDIDKAGVKVITPPGGTNEKFDRANLKNAEIVAFADNTKIFDEVIAGRADVMITDASETRFQQKQHAGVLCAIHPDAPFNFSEKAYLLPRDGVLKNFTDQWLRQMTESGELKVLLAKWWE